MSSQHHRPQEEDEVEVYDDGMSNLAPPPNDDEVLEDNANSIDHAHENTSHGNNNNNGSFTSQTKFVTNSSFNNNQQNAAKSHNRTDSEQKEKVLSVVRKRMTTNNNNNSNARFSLEETEHDGSTSIEGGGGALLSSSSSSSKNSSSDTPVNNSNNQQQNNANSIHQQRTRGSSQANSNSTTFHPSTPSLSAQVSKQDQQRGEPHRLPLDKNQEHASSKHVDPVSSSHQLKAQKTSKNSNDDDDDDVDGDENSSTFKNNNNSGANEEVEDETEDQQPLLSQQQIEQERWRLRKKHVFIFSDAGKPIFTRWGDEADFSELFGILQVLMEMSISNGLGALKQVCLGSHDVHFYSDDHLRFVMVTATQEPPDTCQHQLRLLCHCLLSGFPTVNKMLDRNSSYDVRSQLLHPAVFRSLVKTMNHEIPFIFRGIDCGFFDAKLRNTLNETLRKDGFAGYSAEDADEDGGGHLMSLIVCRGKILAWGQIPNFQLSTDDLLLLIHFSERVCGSASSLDNTWAPLCLPDYDKEGSFWVHVMQLNSAGSVTSNEDCASTSSTTTPPVNENNNNNNNSKPPQPAAHPFHQSTSPVLIQVATHSDAIGILKVSAERVRSALYPIRERIARNAAKVMSLPPEWAQLGVMHVLFNRWGVLAYTAAPPHAQEKRHRKNFLRTLLQVRLEALTLSKTSRPFLMRSSPFETICFTRKVVKLKSAAQGRASAELFVTFLPGTEAGAISNAVNRIWDALLNKDAWVQFVAARQNFSV